MIPITGFPQVSGTAKEGHRKERFDHGANEASHSTHAFGPRTASRGYTFEACVFEANRFGGEVVVHGHRGSSGTRSFSERYLTNPTSSGRR